MHRPALERVVEILAMRGGAVDERCAGRGQGAGMADCRTGAVVVATGKRAPDIILVAGGDAEPDDVDQQILALSHRRGRERPRFQRRDFLRQRLGD